ncbi:MAG: hypothetical protein QUS07_02545, partial [Methanothrix sp.]|nr:hypothetical protein [Methanothrix sp.]
MVNKIASLCGTLLLSLVLGLSLVIGCGSGDGNDNDEQFTIASAQLTTVAGTCLLEVHCTLDETVELTLTNPDGMQVDKAQATGIVLLQMGDVGETPKAGRYVLTATNS